MIDNRGKQQHHYRPNADVTFIAASPGRSWLAALTATNEVYVLSNELELKYIIQPPENDIMQRRLVCGYNQAFIVDDEKAYRFVAAPRLKYFDWANEIDEWRRGVSYSLKICIMLDIEIIKPMLMNSFTMWLTMEPDAASGEDLQRICRRSIEVTKSFIDALDMFIQNNIKHTGREFWANIFNLVSEVLNNGIPETSRTILECEKNVFAIAECAEVFGIDVFGTNEIITWIIVNQQEAIFRELIYKFLKSERLGPLLVEIIAKTCSTFTPNIASASNNPFFILDKDTIIKSCKKGFAED